ncbi:MAG: sulfate transporter CysZ [Nitrococcus mobilis]|nr:sulfate transporter CysZ [Nitrococcus mobilis]
MLTDFLHGITYVPQGFRLLTAQGLRRFVLLPIAVNVLVFAGLLWWGAEWFHTLLLWLLPPAIPSEHSGALGQLLTFLEGTIRWLLWPLFLLAAVVVMFYTFTALANLIGSPFNSLLSARVEQHATGAPPLQGPKGKAFLAEAIEAIMDELRKIVYFALLGIPLLVLFIIPVVQVVAPFLWGLYGAWIIALEYGDYPLGNRGIPFREQRRITHQHRLLHLGFGAGVLCMTIIPFVNLVAMPTAVIGATLLQADLRSRTTQAA